MSRWHPDQWLIEHDVPRPPAELVRELARYPTTQIADSGAPVGVVGPGITALTSATEICGPAVTLWTKPGDILFVLKSPDLVGAGDVVVIDGGGHTDAALIGDIIGGAIRARGGVGLVVDGAVRDLDGLREVGLPTFARGTHPATRSNEGPGALNVVVQLGGVVVAPGDIIRADSSGIVVVPARHAAVVLERTRAVAEKEEGWRREMAGGASIAQVLGIDARIAELGGADPDAAG
ncbi:RraA family protein [Pseudonocardia humida]|uniref:Putative 4-hydroxy-4-methyl-2-oxoglutarate aldolase n=1 Tax=Pseudonocardia humida TaxID=2800819 RepID=A0ABT1A277_9PSEU|nr:dimethylmenaquinone methyltransferase [Pseudonocardia humida]MCO1656984.1 dimethylmenaquinone methyltransferase [Pseudonocardia humida]